LDDVVDAAKPFIRVARPVIRDLRPFSEDLHDALPPLKSVARNLDPLTNALVPYLPDVAAFAINTRSITSQEDANGGVLRGLVETSANSLPAIFGPNNGVKPIPLTSLDKGQTGLQQMVPVLPGGMPAPHQDGTAPPKKHPATPNAGGERGDQFRLAPPPGGDDAPKPRHHHDGNGNLGGGLLPSLGN
jgi:phospholipid/cholesterol/gamma-HCH transport system substrate-binding protein